MACGTVDLGDYCDSTNTTVTCPTGTYCPDGYTSITCPAGSFCPPGWFEATECYFGLLLCPISGKFEQNPYVGALLVLIMSAVLLAVITLPFRFWDQHQRAAALDKEREFTHNTWDSIKALPFALYWLGRTRRKEASDSTAYHVITSSDTILPPQLRAMPPMLEDLYNDLSVDSFIDGLNIYADSFPGLVALHKLESTGMSRAESTATLNQLIHLQFIARTPPRQYDGSNIHLSAATIKSRQTIKLKHRRKTHSAMGLDRGTIEEHTYYHWLENCSTVLLAQSALLDKVAHLAWHPQQLSMLAQIDVPPEAANLHYGATGSVESDLNRISFLRPIPVENRLNICFRNLDVYYGKGKSRIKGLQNASGFFKPGEITGVLGPSGAGKSTLVNTLHGSLGGTAEVEGELYVCERAVKSIQAYRSDIAVVAQEPIMQGSLTVMEQLFFSAVMLDNTLEYEGIMETIKDVDLHDRMVETARLLGLGERLSHLTSELSTGQRKRLSLGMALMRRPKMLLLDEPTSGLDPSAALIVGRVITIASRLGITVVAVIHQPRIEVYRALTNIILMVHGGRIVFQGPGWALTDYFSRIGFHVPENCNPSDLAMDIVHGMHIRRGQKHVVRQSEVQDYLQARWAEQVDHVLDLQFKDYKMSAGKTVKMRKTETPEAAPLVSVWWQLVWAIQRSTLELLRNMPKHCFELLFSTLALIVLMLIFRPASAQLGGNCKDQSTLVALFVGLTATLRGSQFALSYVHVLKAEERSGISAPTQYFGQVLVQLPLAVLYGICYGCAYFAVTSPHLLWDAIGTLVMTELACRAVGEMFVYFTPTLGLVLGSMFTIVSWALKGVAPPIVTLDNAFGVTIRKIVTDGSIMRYCTQGLLLSEYRDMTDATYDRANTASSGLAVPDKSFLPQYNPGTDAKVFWALLIFMIVFRTITVLFLWWTANNYEVWGNIKEAWASLRYNTSMGQCCRRRDDKPKRSGSKTTLRSLSLRSNAVAPAPQSPGVKETVIEVDSDEEEEEMDFQRVGEGEKAELTWATEAKLEYDTPPAKRKPSRMPIDEEDTKKAAVSSAFAFKGMNMADVVAAAAYEKGASSNLLKNV